MKPYVFSICFFFFLSIQLSAQKEVPQRIYTIDNEASIHIIHLRSGSILKGKILTLPIKSGKNESIIFLFNGKEIEIKNKEITKIEITGPGENAAITEYKSYESALPFRPENLSVSPTAIPLKKGEKEIRAQVPTAAVLASAEFGLGGGFSITTSTTVPIGAIILQGKYGTEVSKNLWVGMGITTLTTFDILDDWYGLTYGMLTYQNEKVLLNINIGTNLFPDPAEFFFFIPGCSFKLGDRWKLGFELPIFGDEFDTYIPFVLPTAGWVFKNQKGGINFGAATVPIDFGDTQLVLPIPYAAIYLRF